MAEEAGDSSSSSRAAALTFNRLGSETRERAILLAIASKVTNRVRARRGNGCFWCQPSRPSSRITAPRIAGTIAARALTRAAYAKFQLYFHVGALALDLYRVSPREYPGQGVY